MAVKIRLARHGKKNHAFFHIVVADVRAPRDGRFIEQIGSYNPNTNPATINLKGDRALYWLNCGAQPTDTCRRILSYEGILLKKHLEGGVKKGAITAEVAEQRFNAWKAEKDNKLSAKKAVAKELLSAEAKVNQERAEAISKRKAEEALAAQEAAAAAAAEAAAQEATEGEVKTEE